MITVVSFRLLYLLMVRVFGWLVLLGRNIFERYTVSRHLEAP